MKRFRHAAWVSLFLAVSIPATDLYPITVVAKSISRDIAQDFLTAAEDAVQHIESDSTRRDLEIEIAVLQSKLGEYARSANTFRTLIGAATGPAAEIQIQEIAEAQARAGQLSAALETIEMFSSLGASQLIDRAHRRLIEAELKYGDTKAALTILAHVRNPAEIAYDRLLIVKAQAAGGDIVGALDGVKSFERSGNSCARSEGLASVASAQARAGDLDSAERSAVLIPTGTVCDKVAGAEAFSAIATVRARTQGEDAFAAEIARATILANGIVANLPKAYEFHMRAVTSIAAAQGIVGHLEDAVRTTTSIDDAWLRRATLIEVAARVAAAGSTDAGKRLLVEIVATRGAKYHTGVDPGELLSMVDLCVSLNDFEAAVASIPFLKHSDERARGWKAIAIGRARAGAFDYAIASVENIPNDGDPGRMSIKANGFGDVAALQAAAGDFVGAELTSERINGVTGQPTGPFFVRNRLTARYVLGRTYRAIATARTKAGDLDDVWRWARSMVDPDLKASILIGAAEAIIAG